ncbi:single-stranded DNA-binding protein 1 [Collibacillus ludicampi]|uniref:Single-stranded DNA-binding protein n=1 Tax=Collibacillus ludicampi TaxID=2771369 RepID=A0AAV4LLD4_9BACL|nr:single-stranded DNA-binding protein [Collibacillus ludicampi]GIM48511.1 single-stranded DNA-binding protein 1 [Collibacillus ludicampi]
MLNRIILIGRLTADPELRYTPQGTAVARFTLAVNRPYTNQGENEADFIDIVVWQKLAETAAQYLKKGRLTAVEGRLQIRNYENREGKRVRVAEVVADSVRFLDRGESNGTNSGQGRSFADDRHIDINDDELPYSRRNNDPFEGGHIDINDDDLPF